MVEELLNKYDLLHASLICGGKVTFNINFLNDDKVYISLVVLFNNEEEKYSYDFINDEEFQKFVLPKIFQRFLTKNVSINIRKIMGNDSFGTLIVQRKDLKDSLVLRNCSLDNMDLLELLYESLQDISNVNLSLDSKIIFYEDTHQQYDDYIKYNIAFDYADYKTKFFGENNDSYVKQYVKENEEFNDSDELLILNIARYAYTFENLEFKNVWEEIEENYKDNEKVLEICSLFKKNNIEEENIYTKALVLAEYEKNNDLFLHYNDAVVEEAMEACNKLVNFFTSSYLTYWNSKAKYYESILDSKRQAICIDFVDAYDLKNRKHVDLKNKLSHNTRDKSVIEKLKKIRDEKVAFANIINNPITPLEVEEPIRLEIDEEAIKMGADDQARLLLETIEERNKLKKDAEEFAKIIITKEKEYKKILHDAEEQARKIIELEKENEELKKLAQDNARYLFERNEKLREEEALREFVNNMPVPSQDIDKINNLLNAISCVKDLDFAVNHPTVMQELIILEEKIVTYLTTHTNIVQDEDVVVPIEKEEMMESKPVIELLAMIRNAYVSSHEFEKDGRHTVIYFNPVDDDTYRVTLYSAKEDSEDILMDAFFESYQLSDNVLEEICDIFKTGAVVVASKIDNIPPDKADYLVIDNMNNAIKFMDCKKDLIEKIKLYL